MHIARGIVCLRRHDYKDATGGKVAQLAPHTGFHEYTIVRTIHAYLPPLSSIVNHHRESSGNRHNQLGTCPMSMTASHGTIRHTVNPEDTTDRKGDVTFGLSKGQAPTIIPDTGNRHHRVALKPTICAIFYHCHAQNYKEVRKMANISVKNPSHTHLF